MEVAMTMLVLVVEPNGTYTDAEIDDTDILAELYRLIGCETVDVVSLAGHLDMWLDDEGLLTEVPEFNRAATHIAQYYGYSYQSFAGTAVFTGGADAVGNTQGLELDLKLWHELHNFLESEQRP
jgi:hypothetical protein